MVERVYIGLGSNLNKPVEQIKTAVESLKQLAFDQALVCSSLYKSAPMGPADQPDYINAVAGFDTALDPLALLRSLQQIENTQGRIRQRRWGERTLDLDLLLYGEREINTPELMVPHPGIPCRPFVLVPLDEIAPNVTLPGMGEVSVLIAGVDSGEVSKL